MEEIRLLGILILLLASNATAQDQDTKDYLDPSNLGDRTFLWKNLFIKMNMMLNVTEKLSLGLAAMNKRLDVVDKRQEELTTDITKLSEEIGVIGKEFYEMNFKSTDDDTGISLENNHELNEINRKMQKLRQSVNPEKATEEISQITANKRLEEIQKRLQLLWEIEMSRNTSYRLDESKLELDKFWKSVPSVIRPKNNRPWKTILRRQDGSVDFNRNWTDYKHGFGYDNGEFFIGLEALNKLTSQGPPQELLVILQDFLIATRYAKYDLFQIGNEAEKYALTELGTYSGDVGDSLREHKGCNFTTLDQDNGGYSPNCASFLDGGWWFMSTFCKRAFLTGPYGTELKTGKIEWDSWDNDKSLSYAEMLIRSKN